MCVAGYFIGPRSGQTMAAGVSFHLWPQPNLPDNPLGPGSSPSLLAPDRPATNGRPKKLNIAVEMLEASLARKC